MKNEKPIFYVAALLVGFIGNFAFALAYLLAAAFYADFSSLVLSITHNLAMKGVTAPYLSALFAAHTLSLIAIWLLWKSKPMGFYLFLLGQLLVLLLPAMQLTWQAISSSQCIFVVMLLAIYARFEFRQLK